MINHVEDLQSIIPLIERHVTLFHKDSKLEFGIEMNKQKSIYQYHVIGEKI